MPPTPVKQPLPGSQLASHRHRRSWAVAILVGRAGLITLRAVVTVRLFAAAREAARTGSDQVPGTTVAEVLAAACLRYGAGFEAVLATSRVWLNGSPAQPGDTVVAGDEVAVLPPVSGGCR